jgi:arginine utilization protein RocB
MGYTADNQILHINIKNIGYINKDSKVWLSRITTPFTYDTIELSNLLCKPFSYFCCSTNTTFCLF